MLPSHPFWTLITGGMEEEGSVRNTSFPHAGMKPVLKEGPVGPSVLTSLLTYVSSLSQRYI